MSPPPASFRAEYYGAITAEEYAWLRLSCARAAQTCGQWDVAHAQLRAMCLAAPSAPVQWALFNAVAGRSRRGYDERWLLRLLMREAQSPLIAVSVAHHCLLSRSFKIALSEYSCLHERFPNEPLIVLCVAIAQMQLVMSRANKDKGHSVLLAFGWLQEYARLSGRRQEAAYNTARAYHHLGLGHLAVGGYQSVLELSAKARADREAQRQRETKKRRRADAFQAETAAEAEAEEVAKAEAKVKAEEAAAEREDLGREAAHNLARICVASGSRDLARQIMRSMPV